MKSKILLLFIALCLPVIVFSQRSEVTVKAGDASILMGSGKACVEFNYSNTEVGEFPAGGNKKDADEFKNGQPLEAYLKQRGEDYVRDWPDDHLKAEKFFINEMFRFARKGGLVVDFANPYEQKGMDYKVLVNVDRLDMGNGAGYFANANPFSFKTKSGGTIFQGTVEIVNLNTGLAECVFDCPFVKGNPDPSETGRLRNMYFNLGTKIVHLAKEGVKNGGPVAPSTPVAAKSDNRPAEVTAYTTAQNNNPVQNNNAVQNNNVPVTNNNGVVVSQNVPSVSALDVVKLKNGSEIKGTIKEVLPLQSVKVETADGSIWVFKNLEIQEVVPSNHTVKVSLKNGSEIKGRIVELKIGLSAKIETADGSTWVFKNMEISKIESVAQDVPVQNQNVSPAQNVSPVQATSPQQSANPSRTNVQTSAAANIGNAIVKTVPQNFLLEDNIVVINKLSSTVSEVIIYKKENGNFVKLTSTQNLLPNEDVTVKTYNNAELAQFRGQDIAVEVISPSIKDPKREIDIVLYSFRDDLRIIIVPYGANPFAVKAKEKSQSSDDGADPTADKGFKMCFDYMHGFCEGNHNDMFSVDFGANVIPGLFVGGGAMAFVGGYDPFSYGVGGVADVRYTAPFWDIRPYADYRFDYGYNFEAEVGGFDHNFGAGVCLKNKYLLGIMYGVNFTDVEVPQYNYRGQYKGTELETVTTKTFYLHFGMMFR